MKFWLGVHVPDWLRRLDTIDVPLFVSANRLRDRRKWRTSWTDWALDSGAFTEISTHGRHTSTARAYSWEVRRWMDDLGRMEWAAIQDWMCEPAVLAKTGLTVLEHQKRTVASYVELSSLAPEVPWAPVLQGWHPEDYLACAERYRDNGVDLKAMPIVGLGSVCRRQKTAEGMAVIRTAATLGLRLHGFGLKITGLQVGASTLLASADSMAWSYDARRKPPLPGHRHANCANCLDYALLWRQKVLRAVETGKTFTGAV